MGLEAQNESDLLKVIAANWFWVLRTSKIVDASFLEENFTEAELAEAGIYTRKTHRVKAASFACGSATVEAYGSATVKACDNSYIEDCRGGIKPQSGYAIVKDYYAHKIYIKKGAFEIIEVE